MPDNLKKALQYLHSAKFQQAVAYYESVLQQLKSQKKTASFNQNMIHICVAYIELQKFQKAKEVCQYLMTLPTYSQEASIYLAIIMSHSLQFQQALQISNKLIESNDKEWKVYFAKGYVLYQRQKFEQASQYLGLAITKNKLNNPKSYILQASCFAHLKDIQKAMKNMQYCTMAMQEDQSKNCEGFYRYQVKNIKKAIKIYEKYKKKLKKMLDQKYLSPAQHDKVLIEIIIVLGKSVIYCCTSYNMKRIKQKQTKLKQAISKNQIRNQNDYQNSQSNHNNSQIKTQTHENLHTQLQKIDQIFNLKSKNSITTQSLRDDKFETNDNICNWLKQKCSIF